MSNNEIVLADQIRKAELMAGANLLPDNYRKQPANILWAMEMAEALDVTLAQAITGISVISGKPSMSAEMMRALVLRHGHLFRVTVMTDEQVTVEVARRERPDDIQQFTFTMQDAQHAELAKSANYRKHPKSMLLARVTSLACRAVFPDVVAGMGYTPDELADPTPMAQAWAPPTVTASRLIPTADETLVVDTDTGEVTDSLDEFTRTESDAVTPAQLKKMHACLKDLNIGDKEHGLEMISNIAGRPIDSTKELTKTEASAVIDTLVKIADDERNTDEQQAAIDG